MAFPIAPSKCLARRSISGFFFAQLRTVRETEAVEICCQYRSFRTILPLPGHRRLEPAPNDNHRARNDRQKAKRRGTESAAFQIMPNRSACRAHVDLAFGERGQLLVGDLLFIERLLENCRAIVAAELPCPG